MRNHFLRATPKAPTPSATNPPFNQVALLLHGDGTSGAQNNTFVDSSSNAFSPTKTGNTAQGSFSPFSLPNGNWSNYFDGNGDILQTPTSASLVPSGNYTVEGWFYYAGTYSPFDSAGRGIVSDYLTNSSARWNVSLNSSGRLIFSEQNASGGSTVEIVDSVAAPVNTWVHFAAVKNGTTMQLFKNGVSVGTATSALRTFPGRLNIGQVTVDTSFRGYWKGYISNIRFVVGTALYTSNFTPSTTGLTAVTNTSLLTCQSNRFVDNSSNNFTLTRTGDVRVTAFSPFAPTSAYSPSVNGGSAYFDGSGDSIDTPANAAFAMGTGDFTLETFFYLNALPASNASYQLFDLRGLAAFSNNAPALSIRNTSGTYSIRVETAGIVIVDRTFTPQIGAWFHVAFVRSLETGQIYLNGVSLGLTFVYATNFTTGFAVRIGNYSGTTSSMNGYLSQMRIVKGTAVYTGSTYTVPTAPLTNITNTSLLLSCTNAGIVDNAAKNNCETLGNARINTAQAKYGTASMFFDGTGDYLEIPYAPVLDLIGLPFTIEAWVYPTISKTFGHRIFATGGGTVAWNSTTGIHVLFQIFDAAGTLDLQISNNTGTPIKVTTTGTVPINTWTHVAVCYDGATTVRLFINGIGESFTIATPARPSTNPRANIGTIPGENASNNPAMQGYIDDLRVTNGIALYTSHFIPPTTAFPDL